jgi:membrane protein
VPDQSRSLLQLVKAAFKDFGDDECGVRAAALAYFAVFALPPLLILLVMVAGLIWDPQEVQRALESQFAGVVGESGGRQIHDMIVRGRRANTGGHVAAIASAIGLILGATGAFLNLQEALNRVWDVKPDTEQGGIRRLIGKRLLSFGMLLGLGLLVAVSLALTAAIAALSGVIGGGIPEPLLHGLELAISFVALALLFAALFKYLPDAKIAWRDVWVGGAATGLLFVVGKFAIGLYLARSKPGDAFGAASALAAVLVWAYYAAMIVLFGAELTQQWARQRGRGIEPKDGAVRVIERQELLRPGQYSGSRDGAGAGVAAARVAVGGRIRGPTTPERGGGIGAYLLGLPVLYLLVRRRGREEGKGR